jgi:hypothetical protein
VMEQLTWGILVRFAVNHVQRLSPAARVPVGFPSA